MMNIYDAEAVKNNPELKTFFDLDPKSVGFVFDLNFLGSLLPSQVFGKAMTEKKGCNIINVSSMNAYTPLTKIPAYSGAKAAISNFTQWLGCVYVKDRCSCKCDRTSIPSNKAKRKIIA